MLSVCIVVRDPHILYSKKIILLFSSELNNSNFATIKLHVVA
jgi:hypothetical protein